MRLLGYYVMRLLGFSALALACVLLFPSIEGSVEVKIDDSLILAKLTVAMEAEGESREGKLAVAFVIFNRARARNKKTISDVILAPFQFSCWNTDSPTRCRLDQISDSVWADCEWAVIQANGVLTNDPTNGATHYLNEELTRKIRGGSLPSWVENMTKVATIGKHSFYK